VRVPDDAREAGNCRQVGLARCKNLRRGLFQVNKCARDFCRALLPQVFLNAVVLSSSANDLLLRGAHLDTATIMKARGNSSFSSAPETRTMFKNQNYAKRAGARTDTGPDGGGGLG
jgi:hypothetical protein